MIGLNRGFFDFVDKTIKRNYISLTLRPSDSRIQ